MINMSCFTCEKDLWQEAARLLVINAAVCTGFCALPLYSITGLEYAWGPGDGMERQGAQEGSS